MRLKHSAFTMIELIFVIVIMGIIGKFGVEFLAQAYNSFIHSKVNNELQSNSQLAVEFIANRLQYRIKDSVIARTDINVTGVPVADAIGEDYKVLEWIEYDIDSFRGTTHPLWSGIIDLDGSNTNFLLSPNTNTTDINKTIDALSDGDSSINDAALFFIGSNNDMQNPYGWSGQINDQNHTMHPINRTGNIDRFVPAPATGGFHNVNEFYQLSWTANAVVLSDDGNLTFYYDYQPWNGQSLDNNDAKSSLIMQNVSTFQFVSTGSILKIQVCTKSNILEKDGGDYSLCKEKTIF